MLVFLHFKHGFGSVVHAPNHNGGDVDRVGVDVIHLEFARFKVVDAQGNTGFFIKRVDEESKPLLLEGPDVFAKELGHDRLVWVDNHITVPKQQPQDTTADVEKQGYRPSNGPKKFGRTAEAG